MSATKDIAEARELLERAEHESDPEQECEHIEEALILLETAEDMTPQQEELIANVRLAYARRFLNRVARLKKSTFETWSHYLTIVEMLEPEIDTLAQEDPELAEHRRAFVAMWGPEVQAALERSQKS
ncbi:hypothetical protein DSM104443_00457 [Usitatibacter rugosus]|uniref:Uncharacterized protein n=1 Tax=Usitatibacter rugosus TaxID=2732067 RepID=A0A6M4GSY4_9PROT|nr:hypothetical protein [Usitatibacter rugosus]QJR09413.1 hypothetical protein DSM104443_00457 [Usitatibacter rugosus]